jgi:hypothetical protein
MEADEDWTATRRPRPAAERKASLTMGGVLARHARGRSGTEGLQPALSGAITATDVTGTGICRSQAVQCGPSPESRSRARAPNIKLVLQCVIGVPRIGLLSDVSIELTRSVHSTRPVADGLLHGCLFSLLAETGADPAKHQPAAFVLGSATCAHLPSTGRRT